MKRSYVVTRFSEWIARHDGWEHRSLAIILVATLTFLALTVFSDWGIYAISTSDGSRLFLLSAIVQGLAAILAVMVTVSLVVTQLAAQSYTPRIVNLRLTDFWLWSAVGIYLAAIAWAFVVMGALGSWIPVVGRADRVSVNIALILSLAALAYLVPFTMANIKSLQPSRMAPRLLEANDTDALDEMLRRAVNDGTMTTFTSVLDRCTEWVRSRLDGATDKVGEAKSATSLYLSAGRHACQRRSPDAVAAVMRQLTGLTAYCSDHPRLWRSAADVFNEAVKELYIYSEEWIGRPPQQA